MRGLDHLVQQLVKRRIDVEHVHARGGHHHVTRRHVGHADHALEHEAALAVDDVVVFGLGQGFDQLIGGVGSGVDEFGQFLQKAALVFAGARARRKGI